MNPLQFKSPPDLKSRLLRIQLITAFAALGVSLSLFSYWDFIHLKKHSEDKIKLIGSIAARNLADSVAINDSRALGATLVALKADPDFIYVQISDLDGELLTSIPREDSAKFFKKKNPSPNEARFNYQNGTIEYHSPIYYKGKTAGYLYLLSRTESAPKLILNFLLICFIYVIVSLSLSISLAAKLQKKLTRPLAQIVELLLNASYTGDYSQRTHRSGFDSTIKEFEALAHGFDELMTRLEQRDIELKNSLDTLEHKVEDRTRALKDIQQMALENAHAAGMSEVSNGVLHNIGNVSNSINVTIQAIHESIKNSMFGMLEKILQLMESNKNNLEQFLLEDQKGKEVPNFLLEICKNLISEKNSIEHNILRARSSIDIVLEAIHAQQNYAKGAQFSVELPVPEIIKESLKVCESAVGFEGIKVSVNHGFTGDLKVQKSKIMHVLINLIKNAKEAQKDTPPNQRMINIETGFDPEKGVFLEVRDNGHGFNLEERDKLFNHGFTTKVTGHGFGLHHSANAMSEMGGSISAYSEGLGKGAAFVLWFQYQGTIEENDDIVWFSA